MNLNVYHKSALTFVYRHKELTQKQIRICYVMKTVILV